MEWIGFGFDLDLILIENGVLKNFKECARSACNGNHFSSTKGLLTHCFCFHGILMKLQFVNQNAEDFS